MHPSRSFAWTEAGEMLDFVRAISFCTICVDRPALVHAPVVVGPPERLRFHVSRANPALARLDGARAIASCLGPDAYISPDWYGTDDQVPTWNYLAVEAEGPLRRLDAQALVQLLDDLSDEHEARLAPKRPWTRDKMNPGRFDKLLGAIVGFEMEIGALRGTRKLGQNKSEAERAGAAEGLAAHHPAMAGLMRAGTAPREAGGGGPPEGWGRGNESRPGRPRAIAPPPASAFGYGRAPSPREPGEEGE